MKEERKRYWGRVRCALLALLLLAGALGVYLPLTTRTIQDSDSGELVTAAVRGALLHPPGFPVYSLLSYAAVRIAAGDPIARLADCSAVLQACAGALLLCGCWLLSGSVLVAAGLAAAWLLYAPVVHTATDIEVFALHHVLSLLLVLTALRLYRTGEKAAGRTNALGLWCGLAAGNHPMVVLWAPLVIVSVWHAGYRAARWRGVFSYSLRVLLTAALGLLPYATLLFGFNPAQAVAFAPLGTLDELWHHMLRSGYGTFALKPGSSSYDISYFFYFLRGAWTVLPIQLLSFFLLAFLVVRRQSGLLLALFLSCALHLWFGLALIMPNLPEVYGELMSRFYPSLALAATLTAAVVSGCLVQRGVFRLMLAAVVLVPPLLVMPEALMAGDARGDRIVDLELEQTLAELPEKAVFMAAQDRIAMGLQYKQLVEGRRSDVLLIVPGLFSSESYRRVLYRRHPELAAVLEGAPRPLDALAQWAREQGRGLFAYPDTPAPTGYAALPVGLTWQWLPVDQQIARREMALRLYGYCARWPDELNWSNPYRPHSMYVKERYFYFPLVLFKGLFKGTPVETGLDNALRFAREGRIPDARSQCREMQESIEAAPAEPPPAPPKPQQPTGKGKRGTRR